MVVLARLWPPVQSDQLFSIGADSSPATFLLLSIYYLLLYVGTPWAQVFPHKVLHCESKSTETHQPTTPQNSVVHRRMPPKINILFQICSFLKINIWPGDDIKEIPANP